MRPSSGRARWKRTNFRCVWNCRRTTWRGCGPTMRAGRGSSWSRATLRKVCRRPARSEMTACRSKRAGESCRIRSRMGPARSGYDGSNAVTIPVTSAKRSCCSKLMSRSCRQGHWSFVIGHLLVFRQLTFDFRPSTFDLGLIRIFLGEQFSKSPEAVKDSGFHGAEGAVERLGDFVVAEARAEPEDEGVA